MTAKLYWVAKAWGQTSPDGGLTHLYTFTGSRPDEPGFEPEATFASVGHSLRELGHGDWLAASAVPPDLRIRFLRAMLLGFPEAEAAGARLAAALHRGTNATEVNIRSEFGLALFIDEAGEAEVNWAQLKLRESVNDDVTSDGGVRLWTWRYERKFDLFQVDTAEWALSRSPELAARLAEIDEQYRPEIEELLRDAVARFEA
jgi:hypothetical protein